jgi:hypothetical protein
MSVFSPPVSNIIKIYILLLSLIFVFFSLVEDMLLSLVPCDVVPLLPDKVEDVDLFVPEDPLEFIFIINFIY